MRPRPTSQLSSALRAQKWPTLILLPVLIVAMLWDVYAVWGALFVVWGLTSALSGQVYLIEPIERRDDPALFWIILGLWIGSGLLYIHATLAPYL